jgi:DNA-binding transcriptional LysR family regulator
MPEPSFDLNLIPVLRALVTHRSVTRAAAALMVSQPQLSRSLARLRQQCGDALLVRAAGGMEPTDTALQLIEAFGPALDTAAALLAERRDFVPAAAERTFKLSMNDYEAAVLMPALLQQVLKDAPGVQLAVISKRPVDVPNALEHGLIELAIGRFTKPAIALRFKPLFEETMVAVVRAGHPLAGRRVSVTRFAAQRHLLVSPGGHGDFRGLLDDQLDALGLTRRVVLSMSQFLVAPWVAAQSDTVLLLPRRLLPMVGAWGLRTLSVPLQMPRFQISMLWRERSQREPAHRWLRQTVVGALQSGPDAP